MQENNPQIPVAPVQTNETIKPVEVKKSFSVLTLILIFVLILSLAGSAYLMYQNMQLQKQILALKTTPTPAAIVDPIANWKTYVNTDFNFSFKYPANYGTTGAVYGPYTGTSKLLSSFSDPATIRDGTDAPFDGFNVYAVTDMKAAGFQEYMNNELAAVKSSPYGNGSTVTIEKVDVLNITASSITISPTIKMYYLLSPDGKNVIVISRIFNNQSFLAIFDQILSTFKFTSSTKDLTAIKAACIALQGSEKNWDDVYKECNEGKASKSDFQTFCSNNNGTFQDNVDYCRHATGPCGPSATYTCSFK